MTAALDGLGRAFSRCIGELGMWSASRLFVGTARTAGGPEDVSRLADHLGPTFPVLEHVADAPPGDVPALRETAERCASLRRLVVVGLEADPLAALLDVAPPSLRVALILDTTFPADVERLRASWGPRVELTDASAVAQFAGSRSALLTFVYGAGAYEAVVQRLWLRLYGPDARAQFGALIGWNLLPTPMQRHPKWLAITRPGDFTERFGDAG